MNYCEFIQIENLEDNEISTGNHSYSEFICKWCGRIVTELDLINSNYSSTTHSLTCLGLRTKLESSPSLPIRLFNFSTSFLKHLLSGRKRCTTQQIRARFLKCVPCRFYNKLAHPDGQCQICGCHINLFQAHQGLNKLAWTDAECSNTADKQWLAE